MTTHVDDVTTRVGLLIDGEVVAGAQGTYDEVLAADVASRLEAGTVFVNTHGISATDMYAPMGGWKQSGFGVELGTEGMQAYARQRVTVRRPGQGSWGIPT
jgi:acyl-CoA reductase-like NAD-dependent aldehyde dehydrogenase